MSVSAPLHPAVAEEEALLAKVQAALAAAALARSRGPRVATTAELIQLREDAQEARIEDAAPILHELAVRQELRGRAPQPLPDPASPYLAHLRLREEGRVRDYLLGHGTYVDAAAGIWVVDWRVAPVAQLFYRYREGDTFEESFPGREASGVVEVRRILVVHRGELLRILGDGLALEKLGGSWSVAEGASIASGGAGTAARPGSLGLGVGVGAAGREARTEVTALLDAEQFAAIASPPEKPLLVLGSAGSGKTTVALHRLVRLSATAPERLAAERAHVVVPEEGLAWLAARLLAPLGGKAARVRTLDDAFLELARETFGGLPRLNREPPALVVGMKRHPALYDALRRKLGAKRSTGAPALRRLRAELGVWLTDRPFLADVVARSQGTLPLTAIEETVQHTMAQLADDPRTAIAGIAEERRTALDRRELEEGTRDELAGTLDLEDLPLLLTLAAWRGQLHPKEASQLVLDEAEDFSLFDLDALAKRVRTTRAVTLAGDEAQQTHSSFAGWTRSLAALGVRDAATCRLAVSYRCPRPIAALARDVLGPLAPAAPAAASREGAPVGRFPFPGEAQAWLFLAGALRELVEAEPNASCAVIAHDEATARRFAGLVEEVPRSRLVLDGSFGFEPGLDVTHVDAVKGLEWDYVVVPDATEASWPESDEGRRRFHVAVTRASHQLWLVWHGRESRLLGPAA